MKHNPWLCLKYHIKRGKNQSSTHKDSSSVEKILNASVTTTNLKSPQHPQQQKQCHFHNRRRGRQNNRGRDCNYFNKPRAPYQQWNVHFWSNAYGGPNNNLTFEDKEHNNSQTKAFLDHDHKWLLHRHNCINIVKPVASRSLNPQWIFRQHSILWP